MCLSVSQSLKTQSANQQADSTATHHEAPPLSVLPAGVSVHQLVHQHTVSQPTRTQTALPLIPKKTHPLLTV